MELDATDLALLAALRDGLPLVPEPYRVLGESVGLGEAETLARLKALQDAQVVKRFGVVVRHHELGYETNAMAVWDVPDAAIDRLGESLAKDKAVTLCYRRRRALPDWPYNLFCMIHGKSADWVKGELARLADQHGLAAYPGAVLFSTKRYKQRGAWVGRGATEAA
ncbi:MAG: AsnC family transcriptional regulator [Rhodospirillales bacterium]|nr:AsnC family transcriptional regulator [Rhodospirillales bacterium]